MTTPKIATFHRSGGRFYVHPSSGDSVPGVTTVLGMLPKPYLKAWAAKEVAQTAVAMAKGGDLIPMVTRDPEGTVDYLKRSPDRNTRTAADIGTAAHGVFEALSLGQPLGPLTEGLVPFAKHFADFLDKVQPTYHRTEDTVWSESHAYAGSFDSLLEIEGEMCWGDNKTTRSGVHAEVALQLAAYRAADYILDSDSGEQHLMPRADRGVVIHVRPEGWALYEVPVGDEVFEFFLTLRRTFEWDRTFSKSVVGKPLLKGAAA